MTLICLASAHGAPGVTTAAVALAGVWPEDRRRVLVEADPFGGVVAARLGLADTPGLVSLAAVARHGFNTEMIWHHSQQIPGGLAALVGPPSADQAHAVIRDLATPLAAWAGSVDDIDLIVDCGRLTPSAPHTELLRRADRVLILARPSVDQLRPAFHRRGALGGIGIDADLVLVGDTPYGPAEVESGLGVKVAGMLAWDPPTAAALAGTGRSGDLARSVLVRSASTLVAILATGAEGDPAEVAS